MTKPPRSKVLLVITDGIGNGPDTPGNAFARASKPTYDRLFAEAPYSLLEAAGPAVGLPTGQMGNSEVGHLTLGSGRILKQNMVRIRDALQDGSLAANDKLQTLFYVSRNIHIIGLLSDGGVHSHIDHIQALAQLASQAGCRVYLHAITDGRDVEPRSALRYLEQIRPMLNDNISIATISGRFYSMDRDRHWDRVETAYRVIVEGAPETALQPSEYIDSMYARELSDEFILPVAMQGYNGLAHGDGVIFANFRADRMREIVSAIGAAEFSHFERIPCPVNVLAMTSYDSEFNYPVLFRPELPENTLSEIISSAGLRQFHTAETEKYAHVTFFFNGGKEALLPGEERKLIPSPRVRSYAELPQMSAEAVADATLHAIDQGYDFILVNFANGDMVGHSGDLAAAIRAVESVDRQLGRLIEHARTGHYAVVITSDHGNVEMMMDDRAAHVTSHTTNPVYFFVLDDAVRAVRDGGLCNVAASVLELMGLARPPEMCASLV
jgi:2,3-bisphosphoglycerate-independent phosphoglycerate mutase